jgi:PAS domain S-box-containing protein
VSDDGERERLRQLFEQLPAAIAILRGPSLVYEVSNAHNKALAGGRDMVGKTMQEALPEFPQLHELVEQVYRTGETFRGTEFPARLTDENGVARDAYLNGAYVALRDARGEIDGVAAFAYEVTDQVVARKRAEASEVALRSRESQLRIIIDSLPALVAYIDRDLRYRFTNHAYSAWFGYRPGEIEGRGLPEVVGELAWKRLERRAATALAGDTVTFEDTIPYREGGNREVRGSYVPHRAEDGTIDGFIALVIDVTEQRAAERERVELLAREQQARADAEAAVRKRDEFLSIASHELKTPLTAFALQLKALTRGAESGDPAKVGAAMSRLGAQLGRLERLVDELLDVSRISEGRLPLAPEAMDLIPLLDDVLVQLHGSHITRTGVDSAVGVWDRARLDQVFTNLVSNAIKYGEGKPIEVRVSALPGTARVEIIDRGIGIDAGDLRRIFDRFERAVSARRYGGLGLGLWIARSIVEAHKGTIEVQSVVSEGSTFIVDLPRGA